MRNLKGSGDRYGPPSLEVADRMKKSKDDHETKDPKLQLIFPKLNIE